MAEHTATMGYCPECGAPGAMREKRIGGNTTCVNRHTRPTSEYVNKPSISTESEIALVGDPEPEGLSLNAGAELEDELENAGPAHDQLFQEVTPGEVPELREDLQVLAVVEDLREDFQGIAALEAQLQDLTYLREDLLRTQGMTRAFALEGQRLLPGFGHGAPAGYYSVDPSATRYKVSLEEVSKGIWALIAAAAAAVIAAIVKFVQWFRKGKASGQKAAEEKAQTAKTNLDNLEDEQKRMEDLARDLQSGKVKKTGKDGQVSERVSMSSLVEELWDQGPRYELARKFLQGGNPIFSDIIHQREYSQEFRKISAYLPIISDMLRTKLRALANVVEMDKKVFLESAKMLNMRTLDVVAKPLELSIGGVNRTLLETADHLMTIRQSVGEGELTGAQLDLDLMMRAVIKAYRSSEVERFFREQAEIVEVFQDLDVVLEKLRKKAGDLSSDGAAGHNTEGVASYLRTVIFRVAQDINGYRKLFAELAIYGAHLEHLANQTVGFAREIEQQLMAKARRGQFDIPEEWKKKADTAPHSMESLFRQSKDE